MAVTQTEADFEQMSWHDCHIWRIEFRVGEPEEDDWTSDLMLGLDFILEWLCGVDGSARFKIAPATLVFHGVTDPKIAIGWGDTDLQAAIHDVSIGRVKRDQVQNQKVYLDRPYFRWTIELNWPKDGRISFGAVGYTQTLLSEPIISERQRLSLKERSRRTTG
jgi:hypothetical protein